MANANLLKGGVMVVLLLAALAVFDALNNYATNQITGAYSVDEGDGVSGLSVDVSNYPSLFTNAFIVTGDSATSAEVAPAGVIADSLDSVGITSAIKKASEVTDPFAQNVISVGTGCVNYVTQQIQKKFGQLDSRYKCYNPALSGEGVGAITLYDFGNGNVGLVVEGYTNNDLRRAANVLKSYKDWQAAGYLIGKGVLVEATSGGGTKLSGYGWATATVQTACTDSDGGNFPDLPGEIHISGQGFGASHQDECFSGKAVREFYCENGQSKSELKSCPQYEAYQCRTQYGYGYCANINTTDPYRFVTYPPPDCSRGEKTYMREGETKRYGVFDGKVYEVTADFVSSMTAKFTVNGKVMPTLTELGEFALSDGNVLKTFTTIVDKRPYGMQFCLQKATDVTAKAASVAIKAGWNIIGINTVQNLVSTTCGRNQIDDTIWAYYPQANKYGKYKLSLDLKRIESAGDEESDNLRNTYQGTLSATGAFWLYSKGEACTMISSLAPQTSSFDIADGWNMAAAQTNWQGKKLSDLLGSCNFKAGYFFDPVARWALVSRDTVFETEHVGKGFWMYATSCSFKALVGTTAAPPTPPG